MKLKIAFVTLALTLSPLTLAKEGRSPALLDPANPPEPAQALLPVEHGVGLASGVAPKIVNGVQTSGFPAVGLLLGPGICTGTLIGCRTFLTAAHCVEDELNPAEYTVFFQHNGFYDVSALSIAPGYQFGVMHDIAVMRLETPVDGLAPAKINTVAKPGLGTEGLIAGFGLPGGTGAQTTGIKRAGLVSTASCQLVPNNTHICWDFVNPLGPPGTDSNTCQGDSGGPLFVETAAGTLVAGTTSGGKLGGCDPTDHPFDADVFLDRTFIQGFGGADLNNATCGSLPPAGGVGSPILAGTGTITAGNPSDDFSFQVPAGTDVLLVTLNGELTQTSDIDLLLNPGTPPTTTTSACVSDGGASLETCVITNPTPGTWFAQALRFEGSGLYQITVTLFGAGSTVAGPCTPSSTVLCISDQPNDRRFSAEVAWNRTGALGNAGAIALDTLGVTRGGLFWIGNPANPEILLKVLNGCAVNNHYWVFYSAGTNQGLDITVRDTVTGRVWTDSNPNGTLAAPVADTQAFPCS